MTAAPNERTVINIALVDDENSFFSFVTSALDAQEYVAFSQYSRLTDFANSPLTACDICIVDVYFDGDPELTSLLPMIEARWPLCKTIVLSNYADFVSPNIRSRTFGCIAKPDFMLKPSLLRTEVIAAIESMFDIDESTRTKAVDALLRHEHAQANEPSTISEIRHERIAYPLCEPAEVLHDGLSYTLAPLADWIVGKGKTLVKAELSFARQFHIQYQRLRSKLPTESDEQELWSILDELVDSQAYDMSRTLITTWELACVQEVDVSSGIRVRWHGGNHHEEEDVIRIESAPASIVGLSPGDWFSCTSERQAIDKKLVAVVDAWPIESPSRTPVERPKSLDKMKGAREQDSE